MRDASKTVPKSTICDNCAWSSLAFHLVDNNAAGDDEVDAATAVSAPSQSLSPPSIPKALFQKGLHFLHANTRSLIPKLPKILISDFNVLRRDCDRTGGGVAL